MKAGTQRRGGSSGLRRAEFFAFRAAALPMRVLTEWAELVGDSPHGKRAMEIVVPFVRQAPARPARGAQRDRRLRRKRPPPDA